MKPRVKAQLHSSSGRSSKLLRDHTQIETVVEVDGVGRLLLAVDSAGGYSLLRHNLVDRYRLLIFPLVIGSGKRLFPEGTIPSGLRVTAPGSTRPAT